MICFPLHLWPSCQSSPMALTLLQPLRFPVVPRHTRRLLPQMLAFASLSDRKDLLRTSPWLANSLSYVFSLLKSQLSVRVSVATLSKPSTHLYPYSLFCLLSNWQICLLIIDKYTMHFIYFLYLLVFPVTMKTTLEKSVWFLPLLLLLRHLKHYLEHGIFSVKMWWVKDLFICN